MWGDLVLGSGLAVIGVVVGLIYTGPGAWLGAIMVVAGIIVVLGPIWAEIR
jgi:hypothetical protein